MEKTRGGSGRMPPQEKSLKSGPLRHFQHSGAKIRVFGHNTDIIKILAFYSWVTAHKYSILRINCFCQ